MSSKVTEDKELPTAFAIKIAEKFGIYEEVNSNNFVELQEREDKLRMFQQMAISSPFEEALLAYYEREFSQEQLQALRLIYKATASWLRGEVVGVLLKKIQNTKITNKDFAESISVILEQLESEQEDGNRKPSEKMTGLSIKLAGKEK